MKIIFQIRPLFLLVDWDAVINDWTTKGYKVHLMPAKYHIRVELTK